MRRLALFLCLFFATMSAHAAEIQATKTFNLTAHQFTYDVSPAPFTVDQGDTVTIVLTASDDGIGAGHGFFLEQYAEELNVVRAGQTRTIQFVATLPGVFTYFCTQVCGEGHEAMAGSFTVLSSDKPPPTITSFEPARGPAAGGNSVTIHGTGFESGASVLFGEVLALNVSVASSTRLVATAPAQSPGSVAITVVNPDQKGGTSASLYTYDPSAATVAIESVTPSSGTTAGGTPLAILGTGFEPGATVTIGTAPAVGVSVINSGTIRATTPLGPTDIDTTASRDVVVANPSAGFARLTGGFTWQLPPPAITLIAPRTGSPSGGTEVTITGAGFSTVRMPTVLFGGVAASSVVIVNAVTLIALTPHGVTGTVDVVIRRGTESATLPRAFTFDSPPAMRRRAVRP